MCCRCGLLPPLSLLLVSPVADSAAVKTAVVVSVRAAALVGVGSLTWLLMTANGKATAPQRDCCRNPAAAAVGWRSTTPMTVMTMMAVTGATTATSMPELRWWWWWQRRSSR